MSEGGGKKKPLDIIDHMAEHLSSYDGRYLVIPPTTGPYPSYYPYLHQPFLYQQIHPHYYSPRGYGNGGETGPGCLIENMVGNWSPDLTGTYSPFGGGVPPQPSQPDIADSSAKLTPPSYDGHMTAGQQSNIQQHVQPPGQVINVQSSPQTVTSSPQHQISPPKKQRIVAEVKPLRLSYSDVVSKSAAPPLSPATKTAPPPPAPIKSPVIAPPSKDPTRHKASKQNGIIPQPNAPPLQGGKEIKKENLSDDILDAKKVKKNQADWNDNAKFVDASKQNKHHNQTNNKKTKQNNKQTGRDEKVKSSNGKIGYKTNIYCGGLSDVYRKYVAVSEDEDIEEELDEVPPREPSPPPRQQQRLHHSDANASRKQTGAKVERTVNASRSGGKSKRSQRALKRKESKLGLLWKHWQEKSSYYLIMLATWLINLLVDVAAMSAALLVQLFEMLWRTLVEDFRALVSWLRGWWSKGDHHSLPIPPQNAGPAPLQQNIQLPTTGEEAMKRLLSCKGKDPYSILGLTSSCTDEDIRRYYRSQALLVHPDKNSQPGAEEAFKILVHAFDLIAEPEKRAAYDRYVSETNQVEQAWSELSDLLTQLHEKMHYAATTIRCNNCGKRHKRTLTERPVYAARYCAQCNIHHSAKEGDMWCEVGRWLFSRRYLACMEGSVYEITDWAKCQGGGLAELQPHAHSVHYRILLGSATNQYNHDNHSQPGDTEFEDLLSSIYGQSGTQPRHRMNNQRRKGGKKSK